MCVFSTNPTFERNVLDYGFMMVIPLTYSMDKTGLLDFTLPRI